jgi:hypothetical protein
MEIALVQALPVGNAVDVSLNIEPNVSWLRLLRKLGDRDTVVFSGASDPQATRVIDVKIPPRSTYFLLPSIIDYNGVSNNSTYSYKAFGYNATSATWSASPVVDVTVEPTAALEGADPLDFLVERIAGGMVAEVAAQRLRPKTGRIPVHTAPPQTANAPMPIVTVHLDIDQSAERAIGERINQDLYIDPDDPDGSSGDKPYWEDGEGWISRWTCTITGWSLNPDERNSLRKAIKRILMGNLPVFEQAGMIQVDLSIRDTEDMEQYNVPLFMTVHTLSCLAPANLIGVYPAIAEVDAELRENP